MHMYLKLSKERHVTWFKDTQQIIPSERLLVCDSELEHQLRIEDASVQDSGSYSAQVDDNQYGLVMSKCTVVVKGLSETRDNFKHTILDT